jgi:hypothetical protein
MRETMQQAWKEYYRKRQTYWKPRLKTPRRLLIDVLTNRQAEDSIVDE